VVQQYVAHPYLIGGCKFDLRVYALVTCFAPLTVWVYRSGFARFTTARYSSDPSSLENPFIHLTNVAVQKTSADYNSDLGGKWSLDRLRSYLACRHGVAASDALFREIQNIILRSLLSVQKQIISDRGCFELYGFDVLLDAALKPWLLEVNASPSMTASTPADYALKYKLLSDTLDCVDMEQRLTGTEDRIGGFDLVWRNGQPVLPQWRGAASLDPAGGVSYRGLEGFGSGESGNAKTAGSATKQANAAAAKATVSAAAAAAAAAGDASGSGIFGFLGSMSQRSAAPSGSAASGSVPSAHRSGRTSPSPGPPASSVQASVSTPLPPAFSNSVLLPCLLAGAAPPPLPPSVLRSFFTDPLTSVTISYAAYIAQQALAGFGAPAPPSDAANADNGVNSTAGALTACMMGAYFSPHLNVISTPGRIELDPHAVVVAVTAASTVASAATAGVSASNATTSSSGVGANGSTRQLTGGAMGATSASGTNTSVVAPVTARGPASTNGVTSGTAAAGSLSSGSGATRLTPISRSGSQSKGFLPSTPSLTSGTAAPLAPVPGTTAVAAVAPLLSPPASTSKISSDSAAGSPARLLMRRTPRPASVFSSGPAPPQPVAMPTIPVTFTGAPAVSIVAGSNGALSFKGSALGKRS
jgi:hypothetical protein